MDNSLFNFFYKLSSVDFWASLSLYFSYELTYFFIFLIVIWALMQKGARMYTFSLCFVSSLSAWVVARGLKMLFQINRPFIEYNITPLFEETGYSFPSEHMAVLSAFSFVVYGFNKKIGIGLFIFTVIVGISRMVIGVHYPIDVITGIVVGVGIAYFIKKIFQKTK